MSPTLEESNHSGGQAFWRYVGLFGILLLLMIVAAYWLGELT
jgi:hypothetical protein